MKIKSCEIGSFGKLSDKTVVLDDKITVVRGKNESGKTTLSAFIKYILYGYVGKGRDESSNEKLKYTPRDGSKAFGALVLEASDGSIYRAERRGDGKSGSVKLLDSMGASLFEGTEIGEALYGTDAVTFSKSAFVGQGDIQGSGMKDIGESLEKVLLESDGDEDFDGIRKELVAHRNTLYNKMRSTGLLFELSAKLDELCEKKAKSEGANAKLVSSRFIASETERRIFENKERLEKLYAELENISAYEAHSQLEKIRKAEEKANESQREYNRVVSASERNGMIPDREYLDRLEEALSVYTLAESERIKAQGEMSVAKERMSAIPQVLKLNEKSAKLLSSGSGTVSEKLRYAKALSKRINKLKLWAIILLCLIVTIPVSVVLFVLAGKGKRELSELISGCGFTSVEELSKFSASVPEILAREEERQQNFARCTEIFNQKNMALTKAVETLRGLLLLIGISCKSGEEAEITREEIIPEIKLSLSLCEKAKAVYDKDKSALDALLSVSSIEELSLMESKMQEEVPSRKREAVETAVKYDEGANTLLSRKLSDLKAEIGGFEAQNVDPASLEAEICEMRRELEEAKLKLDAAELAIELVDESRESLRKGVLPKVSEIAGELFSHFTGGKYRGLFFDKDFGIKILATDETETRNAGILSAGAIDAAYIALRIALARVLFKEKPTFIFDESFVRCDDERLMNILGVLEVLSEEFQIIILTCHEREEKLLEGKCRTVILE